MKLQYESPKLIWVEHLTEDIVTVSNKNELEPDWN